MAPGLYDVLFLLMLALPYPCSCRFTGGTLLIQEALPQSTCRNTVQGRALLADEYGFICGVKEVDFSGGCCPKKGDPFQCHGCNLTSKCCDSYEYCVACCSNPKQTSFELASKVKMAHHVTAGTYRDVFDFCIGRCRHNSRSVVHENAYATEAHHCFSLPSNMSAPINSPEGNMSQKLSIVIGRQGQSCETACKLNKQACQPNQLPALNKCSILRKYFNCRGSCVASINQPAEVLLSAPTHVHPGACLLNTQESALSCQGSTPYARRLCPCS